MNWWILTSLFLVCLAVFVIALRWARDRKEIPPTPPWAAFPRDGNNGVKSDSDPEKLVRR